MAEENFSRGFEKVADNTESKIGDCVTLAMEQVVAAIENLEGDVVDELNEAFRSNNVRNCVSSVHNFLGSDYLDTPALFASRKSERKKTMSNVFSTTNLEFINRIMRFAGEDSLNCLLFSRAETLITKGRYQESLKDMSCLLEDGVQRQEVFRVHHKMAQVYAKIKDYTEAVKSLKLARDCLPDAAIKEKDREKFGQLIDESIEKFKNKKSVKKKVSTSNLLPYLTNI